MATARSRRPAGAGRGTSSDNGEPTDPATASDADPAVDVDRLRLDLPLAPVGDLTVEKAVPVHADADLHGVAAAVDDAVRDQLGNDRQQVV